MTSEKKTKVKKTQKSQNYNYTVLTTIPYQCCPVCNGTGKILGDGFTNSIYQTCKVCNGAMIIPMHVLTTNKKSV